VAQNKLGHFIFIRLYYFQLHLIKFRYALHC